MAVPLLDDQLSNDRFKRKVIIWKCLALMLVVVALGWGAEIAKSKILAALALNREELRLLTANAPSVFFPAGSPKFTSTGKVMLIDGKQARLAEVDLSNASDQPRVALAVASIAKLIGATKMGYTVDGTDPDGTPIVHIWALSINEYHGLDDGDAAEHRIARWRLWRNMNATLIEEHRCDSNGAQSERLEDHTRVKY